MQSPDYGILYVDDEVKSLKYFEAIFSSLAPVYVASSAEEGLTVFKDNHEKIGLVLSDKRMPGQSGVDFLKQIRELNPRPLRFLVTAFADLGFAVNALNDGLIYSYLTKPWDPGELEQTLIQALRHFTVARERDLLIEEKSDTVEQLLVADKAAAIEVLSTGLNHHLRNALTVVQTFNDLIPIQLEEELGRQPADLDFWYGHHRDATEQIARMTTLLSNLSEGVVPAGGDRFEAFCLASALNEVMTDLSAENDKIDLESDAVDDKIMISGDRQRISQMLRLLLYEACVNSAGSGEVRIELVNQEDKGYVLIRVTDHGKSISEEERQHLFDPFYVRGDRPEELGTNYITCYLTAFHHGGSIRSFQPAEGGNAMEVILPHTTSGFSQKFRNQLAKGVLAGSRSGLPSARACESLPTA